MSMCDNSSAQTKLHNVSIFVKLLLEDSAISNKLCFILKLANKKRMHIQIKRIQRIMNAAIKMRHKCSKYS